MSAWHYNDGILVESWDDTTRTYTDHRTGESRPYTEDENAAADQRAEQEARLDDHETRLRRIEAAVFPAPPDPEDPEDPTVPTWDDLGGVWPNGGLLRDGGKTWRNVSGVPLTTRPTDFPGTPAQWGHLFVPVTAPDPEPDTPAAWVQPTGAHDAYQTGDEVTHNGRTWRSSIDGNVWEPGVHGWTDIGPD